MRNINFCARTQVRDITLVLYYFSLLAFFRLFLLRKVKPKKVKPNTYPLDESTLLLTQPESPSEEKSDSYYYLYHNFRRVGFASTPQYEREDWEQEEQGEEQAAVETHISKGVVISVVSFFVDGAVDVTTASASFADWLVGEECSVREARGGGFTGVMDGWAVVVMWVWGRTHRAATGPKWHLLHVVVGGTLYIVKRSSRRTGRRARRPWQSRVNASGLGVRLCMHVSQLGLLSLVFPLWQNNRGKQQ